MSTHLKDRKVIGQLHIDRLFSAYQLAVDIGYSVPDSKALAVGAVERYMQSGWVDYANKVRRIKLKTAQVGKHDPDEYERHTRGRTFSNFASMTEEERGWEQSLLSVNEPARSRPYNLC